MESLMDYERSPTRHSRFPFGHWVVAVIFAVAVAFGTRAWLEYKAAQSAETVTLSWNAAAARQMEPSLANASEPAVVMAQSILTDSVVADLAKSALPASAASKARVGEFRSRLELRQTSATLLQVRFRDPNTERAVQSANTVAAALIGETRAATAAVVPSPVEAPPAPEVETPAASPVRQANDTLADSLGQLQAELSATQKKLDSLSSGEQSSYRESNKQQLLTAEVSVALKKVADWRADPANGANAQEPLRRIREALLAVWPASRADKGSAHSAVVAGFNAAGVNAARIRQERTEFAHALDVIKKEQGAVQRLQPIETPKPAAAPASASTPAASLAESPSPAEVPPPVAESEIPKTPAEEPFRLLRPAGAPAHSPLWPVVLAGFCGGALYLAAAGWHHRRNRDEDEDESGTESAVDSQRMITPDKPLRPPDFFDRVDSPPGEIFLPRKRMETADLPVGSREEKSSEISYQGRPMTGDAMKRPFREEILVEEGAADPWIDNMIKTLSETSIGKMFEKSASQNREADSATEGDNRRLQPDRLAG